MPEALFVFFRTEDPRDEESWAIVRPEDVPEWIKHPDNMAHLERGEQCCNPLMDELGWWRAEKVSSGGETQQ